MFVVCVHVRGLGIATFIKSLPSYYRYRGLAMNEITASVIEEIKDRIVEHMQPEKIILFGSTVSGETDEAKDVDILIIKETDLPKHRRAREIRRRLRDLLVPIDILIYTPGEVQSWKDASSAFITDILRNGKVLYG